MMFDVQIGMLSHLNHRVLHSLKECHVPQPACLVQCTELQMNCCQKANCLSHIEIL